MLNAPQLTETAAAPLSGAAGVRGGGQPWSGTTGHRAGRWAVRFRSHPAVHYAEPVKESELWLRMQQHLGEFYCRVWAAEFNLADLQGRTVLQALADGEPCKLIWRAVWAALELPARER